jgi:formate dehydrogenase major subunit
MICRIFDDFGTPPSNSEKLITVEIDGKEVSVPEKTSVLRAAKMAGIDIPKLCSTDTLKPVGSCRLCIVEIEGKKGYPTACTTPVEEGMKVKTNSEKIQKLRKGILELYISDHALRCGICPANGSCELQRALSLVGVREFKYKKGLNHCDLPVDNSNPYFVFDPSKCIMCYRCVEACNDIQGTYALAVEGRGFNSKIKPGIDGLFINSECVSCGACVINCPTGALVEKNVVEYGRGNRFVKTLCPYCGVGCSFYAEVSGNNVIRMIPDKKGKANQGHACVKGRFAWYYVYSKDRITKPMVRESIDEPWRECTWEEAINFVANKFKSIQEKYGRYSIGAVTSSRCTNEETYLLQKLVRTAFRNNNVDNCARVCHAPTGYGLKTAFGTSAGTNEFNSVLKSDVIMIIGANITEGHPVFGSLVKRRVRDGAKLIIIDPRKIEISDSPHVKADIHLQLRPGSNVPLLNAIAHVIISENLEDEEFIKSRCDLETYERWKEFILKVENSPEYVEKITGVPTSLIKEAARLYAKAEKGSIYYGLGITEHTQGTTAVYALANLAMITGNVGREGTGVNPLRGQNNVQGSNDMGSFPHDLSGYRHVSDQATRKLFEEAWNVDIDPEPGLRIQDMLQLAIDGKFKGVYLHGFDPVQSLTDTNYVIEALKSMELVVVHDLFLNETARYAHVFIPGCSFLEKEGTFTNAERRVQLLKKVVEPMCDKQEWEVFCEIARAMGYDISYQNSQEIMEEIAKLTPTYNGITYEKLEKFGGIQWPCNENAPCGTPTLHKDGFLIGKGKFFITGYIPSKEKISSIYPLILTTGRNLFQYNVGTNTRRTFNINFYKEDILEINPMDAKAKNIKDGDYVRLKSENGSIVIKAKITERVSPGVVFSTFHFPKTKTNVLTKNNFDWATLCPEYKFTAVDVEPIEKPISESEPELKEPGENIIIDMANRIGSFFEFYEKEDSIKAIVDHFKKFWHPLLREKLKQFKDDKALLQIVKEAIEILDSN